MTPGLRLLHIPYQTMIAQAFMHSLVIESRAASQPLSSHSHASELSFLYAANTLNIQKGQSNAGPICCGRATIYDCTCRCLGPGTLQYGL